MPAKTNSVPGAPCWIDLSTTDLDRSIEFYGRVFDWEATAGGPSMSHGSVTFRRGGKRVAGGGQNRQEAPFANGWTTYLLTPNAQATALALRDDGGSNLAEPKSLKGFGWMGFAADPSGAFVGLWQPAGHDGYEVFGENGTPVWHELHTRDYSAAAGFYERTFGWTLEEMGETDEFRYSRFVYDGAPQAGIMDATDHLPEGMPSHWQVYFGARDVDHTVGVALEHGATLVHAPENTPYGRLAGLADPNGAYFKLATAPGT